jgi:hypothetical protein
MPRTHREQNGCPRPAHRARSIRAGHRPSRLPGEPRHRLKLLGKHRLRDERTRRNLIWRSPSCRTAGSTCRAGSWRGSNLAIASAHSAFEPAA